MVKFKKPAESEMEILRAMWDINTPVTISQLLEIFKDRNWKIQTMATFLTRLSDKGLVVSKKEKRNNLYSPAVTENQFHQYEARELLNSNYGGSLNGFISALYSGGEIDENEIKELKKWFNEVYKDD